ncbi:MAG: MmgE/PrpD family protein, partial [Burkholderiaceae bacterium]
MAKHDPAEVSTALADFAHDWAGTDIPAPVREQARLHLLDSIGIALASGTQEWAHRTFTALHGLGGDGAYPVIGLPRGLTARDAATLNGVLVHGLDYDDTHIAGVIHVSASQVPAVLAAGQQAGASGHDAVTALVLGTETACRIAMAAGGLFHKAEFQPTGTVGAFGAALAVGRLFALTPMQLRWAQGIVLSMNASNLSFNAHGSWTKRLFPGWAAASALTAAALARQGFTGPLDPYFERGGLYRTQLGGAPIDTSVDLHALLDGLGERWETGDVSIKPYPACHLAHACIEAAIELRRRHGLDADAIERAVVALHPAVISGICEPVARKRRPATSYQAQFSVQFLTASALRRGQLTLQELDDAALTDPATLALCDRIDYVADDRFEHPKHFGGAVEVLLKDGRRLAHRQ